MHNTAMHCLMASYLLMIAFAVASAENRAPQNEYPTAGEIVDRALARAEAQYQSLVEAAFESEVLSITRSLDGSDRITKTERNRRRQYPVNGALFEELVEKNGRLLSDKELRKEEKKKNDFIREVEKRKSRGEHPQPEKEPGIRFNHEFVDRYQLKRTGIEMVREHRCWVIDFQPKEGKLPVRRMMDRALNQSTGRFWISQDDYGLARIEFTMREPFKYWGGFLAVIRNTEGRLDYARVEQNIWLPTNFDLKLDLEVMMVKDIRRHITIDWTDYRRSSRPAAFNIRMPRKAFASLVCLFYRT